MPTLTVKPSSLYMRGGWCGPRSAAGRRAARCRSCPETLRRCCIVQHPGCNRSKFESVPCCFLHKNQSPGRTTVSPGHLTRAARGSPRLDAEFFRRGAFCQHNAVALGLIAADDGGDRAQIDSAAALQRLERRPGQKRRVDVHMEVDFGHGDLLSALAFPLGEGGPAGPDEGKARHRCPAGISAL